LEWYNEKRAVNLDALMYYFKFLYLGHAITNKEESQRHVETIKDIEGMCQEPSKHKPLKFLKFQENIICSVNEKF